MIPAIDGGLLTQDFLETGLAAIFDGASTPCAPGVARAYEHLRSMANAQLGPASASRAVQDLGARPLMEWLGWAVSRGEARAADHWWATLTAPAAEAVGLLVVPWASSLVGRSRAAAVATLDRGLRWSLVCNGRSVRLVDATRCSADAGLEFDLELCRSDANALSCLRLLAGPGATRRIVGATATTLARAVEASERKGIRVCHALQGAVPGAVAAIDEAIARTTHRRQLAVSAHPDQALTAVYRVLFLLFAEARALVPCWHPTYGAGYTVAALADRLERGADPRGTWAALQAMARLAHAGCAVGDLRVTAFNGRLFSPAHAPLLDHVALDDRAVGRALLLLTAVPDQDGVRRRVAYEDLGVEQLGSVYERLLDTPGGADPAIRPDARNRATAMPSRKATGTFYTPRALTDFVVRATLAPLVEGRTADEILGLRIVDPAMGSGAFLVAACRYLSAAARRAQIEEGVVSEQDADEPFLADLRRRVARRCLFGVDANPMAVQIAQLSLWLATLASERPLSFLDHHVIAGNSLLGTAPVTVMERPPGGGRWDAPGRPLEALLDRSEHLAALLPVRGQLEDQPDDSLAAVKEKERALAALGRHPSLARWQKACDLWCAMTLADAPTRRLYPALLDRVMGRAPELRDAATDNVAAGTAQVASGMHCVHWPLAFPEVFLDAQGRPRRDGGFDAVIGNPPWEMLRADKGKARVHDTTAGFVRSSGLYRAHGRGHVNLYQLFVERSLWLLRPRGRLGMIVPAGLLSDAGAAPLRQLLIDRHEWESATVIDNRRAIFAIHRGVRFAVITAVAGGATTRIGCRFGVDDLAHLAPMAPHRHEGFPVSVSAPLLKRLSGDGMAFPDVPQERDASLLDRIASHHPALSSPAGWGVTFGRELNATDDRDCYARTPAPDDLLVVEGKHLEAFRVRVPVTAQRASRRLVARRLGARVTAVNHARLGYREVAAASNRTTLIAALLPAGTVSVHTVFCIKRPMDADRQLALCALLNSFVANYLVRRWVTTHVTAAVMARLPVPLPGRAVLAELIQGARVLMEGANDVVEATLQAACAEAYALRVEEFAHLLDTFPLVKRHVRDAALDAFVRRTPR